MGMKLPSASADGRRGFLGSGFSPRELKGMGINLPSALADGRL